MNFNLAVILRETADASPGKAVAVYAGGQMTYGGTGRSVGPACGRPGGGRPAAGGRGGAAAAQHLAVPGRLFRDPQGRRRGRAAERAAQGAGGGVLPRR